MLASPIECSAEPRSVAGPVLVISLHADPTTLVGAPQNGGVTIYVRELARALAREGWPVDVVTRRDDPRKRAFETMDGVRILRIPAGPAQRLPNDAIAEHLPEALESLREIAAARPYQVVSSHYWLSGHLGDILSGERGVPHVHTLHSLGISRPGRDPVTRRRVEIERRLLKRARIVTLGRRDFGIYAEKYGVVPPRLAAIPAGVDAGRFAPGEARVARRAVGLDETGPWIGYVGRLTREKGIDDLIRAFALLRERSDRVGLFVVGGAQRNSRVPELRALAEGLGVAPWVRFLGPIPNKKVSDAYRAADIVAVPSHYEAFGLVALEARACGIPVVASDVGGLRELVAPESGGCRVAPGDARAWADALRDALDPRELVARANAAVCADTSAYSWPAIARRIMEFAAAESVALA